MTLQIKANNWYRTRGGEIAYVFGINPQSAETEAPVYATTEDGFSFLCFLDGRHFNRTQDVFDLVEHLPDCDSFDWKPKPKLQLEAGKKYITIKGDIVGPFCVLQGDGYRWYDPGSARTWNDAGERLTEEARATENIVSEYVEPTPTYEPWDFESMPDFVRVKDKHDNLPWMVHPGNETYCVRGVSRIFYKELFDHYTQLDGKPCGRVRP